MQKADTTLATELKNVPLVSHSAILIEISAVRAMHRVPLRPKNKPVKAQKFPNQIHNNEKSILFGSLSHRCLLCSGAERR
jgi:hypothetical protein